VQAKELRKFLNESYLTLSLRAAAAATNDVDSVATQDADAKMIFNKFPVYLVDISCPPSSYDVTLDPSKTLVVFKVHPLQL
jgi:hypothetical protein